MSTISAIIVAHNSGQDIGRCITALHASQLRIDEIIVIDHASSDGTADRVRRDFRGVLVLGFIDNLGFGEGVNRGARVATGDYLLLVNPDATVDPECVAALWKELERDSFAGIAVPKLVLQSEPSILNSAGLSINAVGQAWDRGYLERDQGQFDRAEAMLAGSGCVMLVRAETFQRLRGFDRSFFLYYEDLDLCWRCWLSGQSVRYVGASTACHTMRVSSRPPLYDHYFDHRNRLRTLLKNLSLGSLMSLTPDLCLFETGSLFNLVRIGNWTGAWFRVRAWLWNLVHLADTLRARQQVQRHRRVLDASLTPFFTRSRKALRAPKPRYPVAYDHPVRRETLSMTVSMGLRDQGALGLGWYDTESVLGVPCRWCCGYGIAFLGSPNGTVRATISIRCSALERTEVTLRTDHQERGRFVVEPGGWRDLAVSVPINDAVTRVELWVNPTVVRPAASTDRGGDRTLGIAVAELTLVET